MQDVTGSKKLKPWKTYDWLMVDRVLQTCEPCWETCRVFFLWCQCFSKKPFCRCSWISTPGTRKQDGLEKMMNLPLLKCPQKNPWLLCSCCPIDVKFVLKKPICAAPINWPESCSIVGWRPRLFLCEAWSPHLGVVESQDFWTASIVLFFLVGKSIYRLFLGNHIYWKSKDWSSTS